MPIQDVYSNALQPIRSPDQVQAGLAQNALAQAQLQHSALQARQMQTSMDEADALREAYRRGADPSTPEGRAALVKAAPLQAPKLFQDQAALQETQAKTANQNAQAGKHTFESRAMGVAQLAQGMRSIDPNNDGQIVNLYKQAVDSGLLTQDAAMQEINAIPPAGSPERAQWHQTQVQKGMTLVQQMEQQLEQQKQTEAARHNQATEGNQVAQLRQSENHFQTREQRLSDPSIAIKHGAASLTPEQNEALFGEKGAVATGKLDPNRINSRTAAILADAFLKNPNQDMAKLSADISLSRNATFRQRAMTAEVLPEIMGNMVEAGKKVNFSNYEPIGRMQLFLKGKVNDPDLAYYMTQRNDALMTIAGVMRGSGMTDQAHKAEIEAQAPTMAPAALDAWMAAQMKSLGPRLKLNASITKSTTPIPEAPAAGGLPPDIEAILKKHGGK